MAELDPTTNLPIKEPSPVKFNLPAFKSTEIVTTSTRPVESKYDVGTFPEQDLEQVREDRQGFGESALFAATRFASGVALKSAAGLSSMGEFVVNTGRALSQSSLDPYFDTPLSGAFNSLEEKIKEAVPIYNTQEDRDKNFLMRALTDADYWFDDINDGAAFMTSAWLTGMGAGKLLGKATKAIYGSRLSQAAELTEAQLAAAEASGASAAEINKLREAGALARTKLAQRLTNIEQLGTSGIARMQESLAEGQQTKLAIYNDLMSQKDAQGNPLYTEEEAKSQAAKGAMMTFGLNMLLMPLDYQQYSGWFKTFSKSRRALDTDPFYKAFLKQAGKNAITEGIIEEGLQAAMQNYTSNRYTGELKDDPGAILGTLQEYFKGFATKEGWDAMGAGMILGGLFGGATEAFGEAGSQARKRAGELRSLLENNDYLKNNMKDFVQKNEQTGKYEINQPKLLGKIIELQKSGMLSEEMVKALYANYEEAYKTIDNVLFSNWAFSHFEAGQAEELYHKIEQFKDMNAQELMQQGILTEDMKNSKGEMVTPADIAERYKQKAQEYETLYNNVSGRYNIPNRAIHRKVFDEAVIQKETVISLEKINSKIEELQSEIRNVNTQMGVPLEKIDTPVAGSPQEKDLKDYTKKKQDLINTLRDSYTRLNKITVPAEIEKEKQRAAQAAAQAEKLNNDAVAAAKAKTAEIANFFSRHQDKVFKEVTVGEGDAAVTDDFVFAKDAEGNVNPNVLLGLNSRKLVNLEAVIDTLDVSKAVTQNEYVGAKNAIARISKIEELIEKDTAAELETLEKSVALEQELEKVIAEIEELQSYKIGKDSKFRKIGVKGSRVYTIEEYQQALDKALELKNTYEKQLDELVRIYNELEDNIEFLRSYKEYLEDPSVTGVEKMQSLEQFEEGAIDDMIKFSDTSIAELEQLSKEYSQKVEAVSQKLSYLENVIDALRAILTRKKLERAIINQRLSEAATFEEFLRTLPAEIRESIFKEDLEAIRAFKNYQDLSPAQHTELSRRAGEMLNRNPELVLAILDKVSILDSELAYLTDELELTAAEARELSASLAEYKTLSDKYNNQFKDLKNAEVLARNQARLKETFSKIKIKFDNIVKVKQDPKVKAAKEEKDNQQIEPTNLTAEEFEQGLVDPSTPKRDILDVLNGTRGNNMLQYEDGSYDDTIITDNEDQRRWFRTTENLDVSEGYMLRAVSKNNNPFGSRLESKFYDDNTILLVLYYKGEPFTEEGELIFTTMALTPTLEDVKLNKYTNKKGNRGKGFTDEQLADIFENFEYTRKKILNSTKEEAIYFKVNDKSTGVLAEGELGPVVGKIVEKDSEIEDVDLVVVKSPSESIAGRIFKSLTGKKGFVVIGHKGQIVKVNLPTMQEIPGAVEFLMKQFETIQENFEKGTTAEEKKAAKEAYIKAISNISSLINYGNVKGADFGTQRIYFDFMAKSPSYGKFIFNGKEIALAEVDKEELRAFFAQKLFNVNASKLKDLTEYTDPLSGKVFPTYKHFLMSSKDRTADEIPIKVTLAPLTGQQFLNVYLRFDAGTVLTKPDQEVEYELDMNDEVTPTVAVKDMEEDTGSFKGEFDDILAFADQLEEAGLIPSAEAKPGTTGIGVTGAKPSTAPSGNFTSEEVKDSTDGGEKKNILQKAKEEGRKKDKVGDTFDEEGPFKLFEDETPATQAILDAEEAWFKRTFPQFANDYQRVRGLIAAKAIGQVTQAGKVLISDLAVPGTTYHEAFHKVSLFLLTEQERQSIYKDYMNRVGRKLSKIEAEEGLAEAFRMYMLTGSTGLAPATESIFKKLIRLIKEFFLGKLEQEGAIEALFKNIKEGNFANKNVISRPSRAYNKLTNVSVDFQVDANEVITRYFVNALLRSTNFNIDVLENLHKTDLQELYKQTFKDIETAFFNIFDTDHIEGGKLFGKDFTEKEWQEFSNSYADNVTDLLDTQYRDRFIKSHMDYVAQFGLKFESAEFTPDSVPLTPNAPDWIESIKFSSKQNMSNAVRLVLLSLTDKVTTEVKGRPQNLFVPSKYFGLPKITNFEQTVNYLQEKLAGLTTAEEMIERLRELQSFNPVIGELMGKFNLKHEPFAVGQNLSNTLLQVAFVQHFAQTKHKYLLTMINPDNGEIFQIDATSEALKDKMLSIWAAKSKEAMEAGKSFYVLDKSTGRYMFDRKMFNKAIEKGFISSVSKESIPYNPNNLSQNLAILKSFGIRMTRTKEIQYNTKEKLEINRATSKIIDYYTSKTQLGVDDMFVADSIRSSVAKLVEMELPYTTEAIELSHLNPEGETVYSISLNNYLSLIVNKINNDGMDSVEHLATDSYTTNSVWKRILTGDRNALKLVILEGSKIIGASSRGEITSDLNTGDLIVTHFNNIMNNIYPLLRAGDKKLEYGFEINMNAQVKDYLNVFKGYLADELTRIVDFRMGEKNNIDVYNKQGMDLVTFYYLQDQGIIKDLHKINKRDIPGIVNNPKVEDAIYRYIQDQTKQNIELFEEYKLIVKTEKWYLNNGISRAYSTNPRVVAGNKISFEEMVNIAEEFTVRQLMGGIEQTKLFLGDLAFFNHAKNDGPKRVGGTTGTKKISVTGDSLNKWLSKFLGKSVDGKINVAVFEDPTYTPTEFIENAKKFFAKEGIMVPDSFFDEYKDVKSADAQGYITLPAYREFLIRSGQWSEQHEKAYPTVLAGEALDIRDLQLFQPLKPQYYGPQSNTTGFTPLFLKFSLVPLLPRAIKGSKLEQINKMLVDKNIGIATFSSGAKVGAIVNKGLVKADGKIDTTLNPEVSVIDYKYFGIQLDIAPEFKNKVTFGTQFRKLLLSNLLVKGTSKLIRVFNPNTEKLEVKQTSELVREYDNTVADLVKIEMQALLERLKVEKRGNGYVIKDPIHFKNIIMEAALARGASLNVRLGLEAAITAADFNLDVISNKTKVEFILSSLINNTLIRQKTFGDMKVQMSGFGSAKTEMRESGDLKMYEVGSTGVRKIQMRLPHWFKELYGREVNIKDIDPKLLTIIGYRIPTQDYSSMDAIEVVGFLPVEAGNVIQVPEGFPAKGGSDFDIDKMNIFLPNYEISYNKEEALKYINSELRRYFRGAAGYKIASVEELESILGKDEEEEFTPKEIKARTFYKYFMKTAPAKISYVPSTGDSKAAKQNKIIELATQILTSPDNYSSLIKPNTNKTLKSLAEEVLGEKPSSKGPRGKMLEFVTNIKTAVSFWTGKGGVGVAALHNAHHTLAQRVNLHIPFATNLKRKILTGFFNESSTGSIYPVSMDAAAQINLKHNKSEDGGISFADEYDADGNLKISDILAEFINAYVDIAKDPFILNLNAGLDTSSVWLMLIRAGVPAKHVAYFMAQPIIKDYLKLSNIYKSQFFEVKDIKTEKAHILNRIMRQYNIKQHQVTAASNLKGLKDLKENLEAGTENSDFNASLLRDFLVYEQMGRDLSDIMKVATFDTAGVGKTRWHSRALLRKVNNALANTIFKNAESILKDSTITPFYEVGKMAANFYNQGYVLDIEKMEDFTEWMYDQVTSVLNTEEQGKLLSYMENEFLTYLFSSTKANGITFNTDIKKLFTGENSLAHRLNKLKIDPRVQDNFLIKQLIPIINNNRNSTDNIKLFDSAFNSYQADVAYQAFSELFTHSSPDVRTFASDLLKLMLLQGGPNFSPVSLYNFIPNDLFIRQFSKIVLESFKVSSKDINSFKDEFYLNNWHKNEFVPWVPFDRPGSITLNKGNTHYGKPYIKTSIKLDNGERLVKLYALVNISNYGAEYIEVNKRGNGFYLREYYGDLRPSVIKANLIAQKPSDTKKSKIKKAKSSTVESSEKIERASPKIRAIITERLAEDINESARKYLVKEQFKSEKATQYIGDGVQGSSTDVYKRIYADYGIANTGKYNSTDKVWVSSNGKRSNRVAPIKNGELQGVYKNIDKVIKAKAAIIMDTAAHLEATKSYNVGELDLAEYLKSKNYVRDDATGIWVPADDYSNLDSPLKCK